MPQRAPHILLVDDEIDATVPAAAALRDAGMKTRAVPGGRAALRALERERFDVVVSDLNMPGMDGLELVEEIHAHHESLPVVILTVVNDAEMAVEALKRGAVNYRLKPVNGDALVQAVQESLGPRPVHVASGPLDEIIGSSPAMEEVRQRIRRAASADAPVLLYGETGTGKELAARAIHRLSRLASAPFVAQNCATFQQDLFEAELFGYAKGAYTGALEDREGLLERADGGVLLLDELQSAEPHHQAKLLRALDDGSLRRLGERRDRHVTVRVVAATNEDPATLVERGRLRADFFNRLRGFEIHLPPLTKRLDDVPELAAHFAARRRLGLDPDAAALLRELPWGSTVRWDGNVRLLRSLVETSADVAAGPRLAASDVRRGMDHLNLPVDRGIELGGGGGGEGRSGLDGLKREAVEAAMRAERGRVGRAAHRLGVHRSTLSRWMKRYGIDPKDFGEE